MDLLRFGITEHSVLHTYREYVRSYSPIKRQDGGVIRSSLQRRRVNWVQQGRNDLKQGSRLTGLSYIGILSNFPGKKLAKRDFWVHLDSNFKVR